MQTVFMYRVAFFDIFAMMLLGMALLKNGILKAEKSNRYYFMLAVVGYSVGLSVNYWETSYVIAHQFEIIAHGPYQILLITSDGYSPRWVTSL